MLSEKLSKRLPRWCRNVQKNYSFGLLNYNEQQPYIDDVIQEKWNYYYYCYCYYIVVIFINIFIKNIK